MTRVYYKYAIAAIIGMLNPFVSDQILVYDLTRPATFDAVVRVSQPRKFLLILASGKMILSAK
jgi:formate-dependent nitrite reductase membrane component NrfD